VQLRTAIAERRAYRSLDPVVITPEQLREVMEDVRLAPSCFNNQPWRFLFVFEPAALAAVKASLSRGNAWAQSASMIVVVASRRDLDCVIPAKESPEREYFLFDTGMATAFLLLRLTEQGLVAHPIAGYSEKAAAEAVGLPAHMRVVTLVIVGKRSPSAAENLSDSQKASEAARPGRKPLEEIAFLDAFPREA
jgi:nitroreductase